MADQITTSSVVQVTMQDSSGNKQNFNIDNPKNDLTMAAIRTALTPIVNSGNWYSSYGNQFTAVQSATLTQSTKIKLSDSGVVITITPSTATINVPSTSTSASSATRQIFTVEGAAIQAANVIFIDSTGTSATEILTIINPEINELQNSCTIGFYKKRGDTGLTITAQLKMFINNRQYEVPITLNIN